MSENIDFIKVEDPDFTFLKIEPAVKSIPFWYRSIEPIRNLGHNKNACGIDQGDGQDFTIKKCIPVLDALTTGYLLKTKFDLVFEKNNESNTYYFSYKQDQVNIKKFPVTMHPYEQIRNMPIGNQFYEYAFKFTNPYLIKTPPGYSCIFSHPFNSISPFYSLTGIVDTDNHPLAVQFPFLIRKDWQGKIPKGTAIIQITPFKRTDWNMRVSEVPSKLEMQKSEEALIDFQAGMHDSNGNLKGGWYKRKHRVKKRYL